MSRNAGSMTLVGMAMTLLALAAACSSGDDGRGAGAGGSGGRLGGASGAAGNSGAGGATGGGALATYKTCTDENRVGRFELSLNNDAERPFSDIDGTVSDGPNPFAQSKILATIDGCVIKQPPVATATCNPACGIEQVCSANGTCVRNPNAHDLGKVTVTGLKKPLELLKNSGSFRYSRPPDVPLDHPAFSEGADITLTASGAGGYGPFVLKGLGISKLEAPKTKIAAEAGKPSTITWTASSASAVSRVVLDFAVNRHGAVDTWLECEVPDTGSFALSAALTTELFKHGVSGYPSVDITRLTSDTVSVPSGCVEFQVTALVNRELAVPGLVSCQGDKDCAAPKTCAEDLACR